MRLLYAFNHDEAARSFARAAELDPQCALCFWGVSYALGPNYNMVLLPDRAQAAWEAAQKAQSLRAKLRPVDQSLIDALQKRYKGPEPLDPAAQQPYNEAFAAAMRDAVRRYPYDADLQTLLAESLMNLNPWKLWTNDGKPAPGTEEIVAILESVLGQHPGHPGANHYYIHAVEASKDPWRALLPADRLRDMMPSAGHLVHMPAHIYQRIGRYADASEANRQGAAADAAYVAKAKPTGYYAPMYYSHNHSFLAFSAAMEGRRSESVEAAEASARVALASPEMVEMPGMDFYLSFPLLAKVRFGQWDDLLDDPRPRSDFKVLNGLWRFAQGMARNGKGQPDAAEAEWKVLSQIAEQVLQADRLLGEDSGKVVVLGVAAAASGVVIIRNRLEPLQILEQEPQRRPEPPGCIQSPQQLLNRTGLRSLNDLIEKLRLLFKDFEQSVCVILDPGPPAFTEPHLPEVIEIVAFAGVQRAGIGRVRKDLVPDPCEVVSPGDGTGIEEHSIPLVLIGARSAALIAAGANEEAVGIDMPLVEAFALGDRVLDLHQAPSLSTQHQIGFVELAECAREPEFPAQARPEVGIAPGSRLMLALDPRVPGFGDLWKVPPHRFPRACRAWAMSSRAFS